MHSRREGYATRWVFRIARCLRNSLSHQSVTNAHETQATADSCLGTCLGVLCHLGPFAPRRGQSAARFMAHESRRTAYPEVLHIERGCCLDGRGLPCIRTELDDGIHQGECATVTRPARLHNRRRCELRQLTSLPEQLTLPSRLHSQAICQNSL